MTNHAITVRPAVTREDAGSVLEMIEQLAKFENLEGPDGAAKERFYRDGFEASPKKFETILAFANGEGDACGYAIFFETYSTFLCKPSIYIEDLLVMPDARGGGGGTAILQYLVAEAKSRGCGRVEWVCLDWNINAQKFYEKIGGRCKSEWMHYRMDEPAMDRFMKQAL